MSDIERIDYFISLGKSEFSRKDYMNVFRVMVVFRIGLWAVAQPPMQASRGYQIPVRY